METEEICKTCHTIHEPKPENGDALYHWKIKYYMCHYGMADKALLIIAKSLRESYLKNANRKN